MQVAYEQGNVTKKKTIKTQTSKKRLAVLDKKRSHTVSVKKMAREHRKMRARGDLVDASFIKPPSCRAECVNGMRPCVFVSCRHHLYIDVNEESGSIKFNFPDKELWELEETCALDVADKGGITLEEVGSIMNLTRERIRQLELSGLEKLKNNSLGEDNLEEYLAWDKEEEEKTKCS